jgi:hypothetical protein
MPTGESVWRRDEKDGQATAEVNHDASAPEPLIVAGGCHRSLLTPTQESLSTRYLRSSTADKS